MFFRTAVKKFLETVVSLEAELSHKANDALIQQQFDEAVRELLVEGDELERAVDDKLVMKNVKEHFRALVSCWVRETRCVDRAYRKPRGYPGDAKLLESIYDNKPVLDRRMGACFERNFLNDTYAVAVRERKEKTKDFLRQFLGTTTVDPVRILNIACGACRELKELFTEGKWERRYRLACVDHDEEALTLARDHLAILPSNFSAEFIKEDVLNLCKSSSYAETLSGQHLIYSIGLADYLPDRILKKLLACMYQWLEPQGVILLTHKEKNRHKPLAPDWFCDWAFVPRDQEDLLRLIQEAGIRRACVTWEWESSGRVLFALITK